MPIYEYVCDKCLEKFELLKLSSSDKEVCPKCGGRNLTRLLSTFNAANADKSASGECDSCSFGDSCDFGGGCGCSSGACRH